VPSEVDWAAIGAFLSGVGAVIGASWALRATRRRDDADCERRLAALREGFRMGRDAS